MAPAARRPGAVKNKLEYEGEWLPFGRSGAVRDAAVCNYDTPGSCSSANGSRTCPERKYCTETGVGCANFPLWAAATLQMAAGCVQTGNIAQKQGSGVQISCSGRLQLCKWQPEVSRPKILHKTVNAKTPEHANRDPTHQDRIPPVNLPLCSSGCVACCIVHRRVERLRTEEIG